MKNKLIENIQVEDEDNQETNQITLDDIVKLNFDEIQDFIEDIMSTVEVVIEGMDMTNHLSASESISYRSIMRLYNALDLTNQWIYNKQKNMNEDDDILGLQKDNDEL